MIFQNIDASFGSFVIKIGLYIFIFINMFIAIREGSLANVRGGLRIYNSGPLTKK